ncbi:MAG: GNAT family N-acetyltransferase [Candidatus Rokubacteria bacterium]|nr:GNAT family N-acetyltransferase [Candidatus Rokubacteria bacterium]
MTVEIREVTEGDRPWVTQLLRRDWGSVTIVSRGRAHRADLLPGFVAHRGEECVGLLLAHQEVDQLEVVVLRSLVPRVGVGTALMAAARGMARSRGCTRLWLVTTNDNVPAIEFYLRRGLVVRAVHEGAVARSREIKPEIPPVGRGGIPIRDEVEMEVRV